MLRTRIKICGLTRPDDVSAAVAAGADACGFVFAPSPRQVPVELASRLARLVPPPVERVGVFVDPGPGEVSEVIEACGLTAVQFCGSEPAEELEQMPVPVIRVLKVGSGFDWEAAEEYRGRVDALLLDTFVPGKHGGTSVTFDWVGIGRLPGWVPVIVAGGLTADNVGEAISSLRPAAVDVSSGVEAVPGVKDHDKIAAFVRAVRTADEEACTR